MIAVNTYSSQSNSGVTAGVEVDIIPGPNYSGYWKSFNTVIVDFVADSDDTPLIKYWVNKFDQKLWQKVKRLSIEYSRKFPGGARFGFFMYSSFVTVDFLEKFFPHLHHQD